MKNISVLLIGTPNSGKSTLFYALTRKKAETGNRAGVTVSENSAKIGSKRLGRNDISVTLFDLPGIYSLTPHTKDEQLTLKKLYEYPADVIVNVIDSTSLEAGLHLTLSLKERFPDTPMVIASNMSDELERIGLYIDEKELETKLGAYVSAISASNGRGVGELAEKILRADAARGIPKKRGVFESAAEKDASEVARSVLRKRTGERITQSDYRRMMLSGSKMTDGADRLLLSPIFGVPVFVLIAAFLFYISFGKIGSFISDAVNLAVTAPVRSFAEKLLSEISVAPWLSSLINGGILTGICAVLDFLPGILLLSLGLCLLEDSGYLSRVAFLFDVPMRRVGMSGKVLIPVLLGFGCTVSSVLASRNLTSSRERKICSFLLPLISCSARSPLYLAFCATLLPDFSWVLCLLLYSLGICTFLLGVCLLSHLSKGSDKQKAASDLITELPKYRVPRASVVWLKMKEQLTHFLRRAGTVIFLSSVITWLASSFSFGFSFAETSGDSMLLRFSSYVSPLFAPLGFDDPRLVAALISGISAKESALSSLCILFGTASVSLSSLISGNVLTTHSALSFLVFFSLYFPCFPAMTAIYEESKKLSSLLLSCVSCLTFAYICSFLTYRFSLYFFG